MANGTETTTAPKITVSKLLTLIAFLIFAYLAISGHKFISIESGLAFLTAAMLVP